MMSVQEDTRQTSPLDSDTTTGFQGTLEVGRSLVISCTSFLLLQQINAILVAENIRYLFCYRSEGQMFKLSIMG